MWTDEEISDAVERITWPTIANGVHAMSAIMLMRKMRDRYETELRAQVAQLTAERDQWQRKATELARFWRGWPEERESLYAERDDLAAKLAQAQAELHELRIRAGLAETDWNADGDERDDYDYAGSDFAYDAAREAGLVGRSRFGRD